MNAPTVLLRKSPPLFVLLTVLAIAQSAPAREPVTLQSFREQYDAMMSNFERMAQATGNQARQERTHRGREAMRMVTDDQLAKTFGQHGVPDLSVGVMASQRLAARIESQLKSAEKNLGRTPLTSGFPSPPDLVGGCDGVDISADTRYILFIAKEVANSILAAAAWVCNEDILGENGSAACVPLAIAADIANGFFDTATFCAGEVTANQVDANFNRLGHIHDDLGAVQATENAIDTHLTNVDNHIAVEFTALEAHMTALVAGLSNQVNNAQNLLSADLKQVMKLELTPEGQRQIVPAILSCDGTNCPDVLTHCTGPGGRCSWNNVGPLP